MKKFYIGSTNLDKWLTQNNGEVMGALEGCLLDNLLVRTKRGFAGIYEHYLNANSSNYMICFGGVEILEAWDKFVEEAEAGSDKGDWWEL